MDALLVTPHELPERLRVALAGAIDELAVGQLGHVRMRTHATSGARATGGTAGARAPCQGVAAAKGSVTTRSSTKRAVTALGRVGNRAPTAGTEHPARDIRLARPCIEIPRGGPAKRAYHSPRVVTQFGAWPAPAPLRYELAEHPA